MFSVRFAGNIESDIRRGWSAWMNTWHKDLETFFAKHPNLDWLEIDGLDESELIELAEKNGIAVRYDTERDMWAGFHHDGLSVFALYDAETEEEAIQDATAFIAKFNESGSRGWEGEATVGKIRLIKDLGEGWYLLESEDLTIEG